MRIGVLFVSVWAVVLAWGQQVTNLDYFAESGACEFDYNKDGLTDGLQLYTYESLSPNDLVLQLDNSIKFAGAASQRIRLQKSSSGAGRAVIQENVNWDSGMTPEVGEPLRISLAIRADAFQNATYEVYALTGQRQIRLLAPTASPTTGWQVLSAVVPVELTESGTPRVTLVVAIRAEAGSASGTLWIDELRALSARTVARTNRFPCGLKLAHDFLYSERKGFRYLTQPVGIALGNVETSKVLVRHFPEIIWVPYAYFCATQIPPTTRYNSDLYHYDDVEANHPDWFLLNGSGERIFFDNSYYVDIGRTDVRERAWQSLRDFLNRCGRPRYVYLDNFDTRVGPTRFQPPAYPTNESWIQAVVGWTQYVGTRALNEFGTRFIPNAAWAPGFWNRGLPGYPDAPGVPTLPYMGGWLLEHFATKAESDNRTSFQFYGSASGVNGPQAWERRLLRDSIRLITENPDKIAVLIPTFRLGLPDSTAKVRYAIAMCLIVQHENTYVHFDPRYQQDDYPTGYLPAELFIPLGNPVGNFRIQDGDIIVGGLFIREYQNGIVLANPRSDRDFTFVVPRDLYDWDRNLIRAGTQITIPRQTGLVLWSAPEISVSLSPSSVEVLPGETVQFTVTYRNTGTAPGTNVRIAVPLPDGMTLVGSNPTATLENGQVVWVVPNIPVNGTGTLRFTVRVQ